MSDEKNLSSPASSAVEPAATGHISNLKGPRWPHFSLEVDKEASEVRGKASGKISAMQSCLSFRESLFGGRLPDMPLGDAATVFPLLTSTDEQFRTDFE